MAFELDEYLAFICSVAFGRAVPRPYTLYCFLIAVKV